MTQSLSLYNIEQNLIAMLDTEDAGVPPEMLQEFRAEMAAYTEAALEKRDNCAHFIRHVESQIEMAKAEETRLYERRHKLENQLARFKAYVVNVIQECASDLQRGPRRLEGRTCELAAVRSHDSIEVFDALALPAEYYQAEIRVPGAVLEALPSEALEALKRGAVEFARAPIKANIASAIKAGRSVPGARSREGNMRLRIK